MKAKFCTMNYKTPHDGPLLTLTSLFIFTHTACTHWPHPLLKHTRHNPVLGHLDLLILLPIALLLQISTGCFFISFRCKLKYFLLNDTLPGHPIHNFSSISTFPIPIPWFIFLLSTYCYPPYYVFYSFVYCLTFQLEHKLWEGRDFCLLYSLLYSQYLEQYLSGTQNKYVG